VLGTLLYMPPEQRSGGEVDAAADLYAAGIILYETLVGRQPWNRETALRGKRTDEDFRLPAGVDLGSDLREAVNAHLCGLGKVDRASRPSSEQALASANALVELARSPDREAARRKEWKEIFGEG